MPSDAFSRMDSSSSSSVSDPSAVCANDDDRSSSPPAGPSQRERTESESSDRQPRFLLPGAAGSPPKVLTMDEVVDTVKNIENMALAHEIAINPEFKLQPYEPPENSLERKIKEIMHKAFWDVLREQLSREPPCFDHAIQLLAEIKECFTKIISKNNQRALDRICEVLDSKLIQQQAEQGVLDFKAYTSFVLQIMAKSCAPIRDEQIKKLFEIEDVVETFRGILETMALMRLDMVNCLLDAARNEVIANSVEYEKAKFKDIFKLYTDGFPITERWLQRRHQQEHADEASGGGGNQPHQTIILAYIDLLEWNKNDEFPEIVSMDRERIMKLQSRALRLCVNASTLAVLGSVQLIAQNTELRSTLVKQVEILLQQVNEESDLEGAIENVWLQIKTVLNKHLAEKNQTLLDETAEQALKERITQIGTNESAVRTLLWKRLLTYIKLVLCTKNVPPPPPGFADVADELQNIATAFKMITTFNYSVFGEHYQQILSGFNGNNGHILNSIE